MQYSGDTIRQSKPTNGKTNKTKTNTEKLDDAAVKWFSFQIELHKLKKKWQV